MKYSRDFGIVVPDDAVSFRLFGRVRGALWLAREATLMALGSARCRNVGPEAGEVKALLRAAVASQEGVADALMDALETGARENGYTRPSTWTRRTHARGDPSLRTTRYQRVPRYNDNPQATIFMRRLLVIFDHVDLRVTDVESRPGRYDAFLRAVRLSGTSARGRHAGLFPARNRRVREAIAIIGDALHGRTRPAWPSARRAATGRRP